MLAEPEVKSTLIFEQPLNDTMRICLRLEHLHQMIQDNINIPTASASRLTIQALLKTLNVIDRPDLKGKLTQTLHSISTSLGQLDRFPQVDIQKLQNILTKIDQLANRLHQQRSKIGDPLRANEFLNQIRIQLNNPAGICNYKSPSFALWLRQPHQQRTEELQAWYNELYELFTTTDMILQLTRDTATAQKITTHNGFHQQSLDSSLPCQLVRVELPNDSNVYPEISAGKHRLVIRFLKPDFANSGRPAQYEQPLEFELYCCRI